MTAPSPAGGRDEWAALDDALAAATPGPWATYEEHGRDYCDEADRTREDAR